MAERASFPPPTGTPSEEVDDYMTMVFVEGTKSGEQETYTQRRVRKQREVLARPSFPHYLQSDSDSIQAETRSRPKSKAEVATIAEAARDIALSTAIPPTSKGFQIMARLGYKPGVALGASSNLNARTEPLNLLVKEDRGGLGMPNSKRRKLREEAADQEKGRKVEEIEFRERVGREREAKRVEKMFWGAMKILEGLEQPEGVSNIPVRKVNLLWRGLVRERRQKEKERRLRSDFHQSSWRSAAYEGLEDEQDSHALSTVLEEVETVDDELDEFLNLEGKKRLETLVKYLRQEHQYCFWCKLKYNDERMDGCPGFAGDDHD